MMEPVPEDKAWFAPKLFGYGAGLPIRWQGWAVLALFLIAVVGAKALLHGWMSDVAVGAELVVLVAVCALTTQGGWRWRWGDRHH